jgi:hypothetical protein
MSAFTLTLDAPRVTLTLRHVSPNWNLTIDNTDDKNCIYLDNRTLIAVCGRVTISRRNRKPSFQFQLSLRHSAWPDAAARRFQIAPSETAAGEITCLLLPTGAGAGAGAAIRHVFKPLPPTVVAAKLPLEVTVLPPHEGQSGYTLVRYVNTGAPETSIEFMGINFRGGTSLTFTGRHWGSYSLHDANVTATDGSMFDVTVVPGSKPGRFTVREILLCGPPVRLLPPPPRLYRSANPPLEVLVLPRWKGAPDVQIHNTSPTEDLWVDLGVEMCRVPPDNWVKGDLTTTIMSPITSCEYKCAVSDTEVTLTVTIQDAAVPTPAMLLSHYHIVPDSRRFHLDQTQGPFDITVIAPEPEPEPEPETLDPDIATDAVNTLLRALATTHQAVATEILTAHGFSPAQIALTLVGLETVM